MAEAKTVQYDLQCNWRDQVIADFIAQEQKMGRQWTEEGWALYERGIRQGWNAAVSTFSLNGLISQEY